MAQTFLPAAMGTAANDASGNGIRTGGLKIAADITELYALVAALTGSTITAADLLRSQLVESANGAAGEVHTFTAQFVSTYNITLIDYDEIGIEVTAQDQDGFTTTSLSAGNFGYIALVEQ